MTRETLDVDLVIKQCLGCRGPEPPPDAPVPEEQLKALCRVTRSVMLTQPPLLELCAPVKICGDLHGQYRDLVRIFEIGGFPPDSNYLFLGDYVDRGKQSIETITLLMSLKLKYPENVFLLRGNHEQESLNRLYGFFDECRRRYSIKLWKTFVNAFDCMPIAATISDKIFCVHGGLSPALDDMQQIRRVVRPFDIPDSGLICDLLWSDPDRHVSGWTHNSDRRISYFFGEDVVNKFLRRNNFDLVVRAHQVAEDGYEFLFHRRLVTLFSAPNYDGNFDNAAVIMEVDAKLMCKMIVINPDPHQIDRSGQSTATPRECDTVTPAPSRGNLSVELNAECLYSTDGSCLESTGTHDIVDVGPVGGWALRRRRFIKSARSLACLPCGGASGDDEPVRPERVRGSATRSLVSRPPGAHG